MPGNGRLRRFLNDLLFPLLGQRLCTICGRRLDTDEEELCTACMEQLPLTHFHAAAGNPAERLFWGHIPVVRANSLFHYHPQGAESHLVIRMKYQRSPATARSLGRLMALDAAPTGFFAGIDTIVPVPLTATRERQRGYNQSERLARGIADVAGLPVETGAVCRRGSAISQTQLHGAERRANVKDVFQLIDAARVAGRHLLLVDDVLTTGSTLLSLARTLQAAGGVRFSILTLAIAGEHFTVNDGGLPTTASFD